MPGTRLRTLVVAQAWVGDMVLSQILLKLLRQAEPDSAIDVVAPPWSAPLLARMPEVDRHIVINVRHGRLGTGKQIRTGWCLRGQYDQAIVIPRSVKAAIIPWLARIPRRIGYVTKWQRLGLINDSRLRPAGIQKRLSRLASPAHPLPSSLPRPSLMTDQESIARTVQRLDPGHEGVTLALAPGAAKGRAKRWPVESFARLARMFADEGYRVRVLGGPQEHSLGHAVQQAAPDRIANLCGAASLDETIDLLAGAQVAVCNDSGLLHVAAAVNVPVVGIYGATNPATHPPLTDRHAICYQSALCSPCSKRVCPYATHPCMTGIPAEDVREKILGLIRG